MTSEAQRRFPFGLTVAATAVVTICCVLGVWQLQRATWKKNELARIAAVQHAAPTPVTDALTRLAQGANVDFTPVTATCAPAAPAPALLHMTTDHGEWVARALSPCVIAAPPYDGLVVDRGFVTATRGQAQPPPVTLPAPVRVAGVLYAKSPAPASSLRRPAPVVLLAKSETPAAPGIAPSPYPGAAADQLQYVGSYAPTWFALAGVAACFYAAMLWRRYHPHR